VKQTPLKRRTPLVASLEAKRAFEQSGRRSSAKSMGKPAPVSPASPAQRAKVERMGVCVNCGAPATDPMHLWDRSLGGCDHAACTVPGCRACHDAYDAHELDLSPVLALPEFRLERAHMALHASFPACLRRLSGRPWAPTVDHREESSI
jgi:hypothetical protein